MDIENCPKCGTKMVKGTYYTSFNSLWDLFKYGLPDPVPLLFKTDGEEPKEEICIKGDEESKGLKCAECGLMLIDPPPIKQPAELPECPNIVLKGV
ncbi:MAG: hypothetical protein EHM45_16470 [Desulfobacteraceae bacterium]|nr:MAG: hypothetical protein EHM45_16470 [Desulfobacteraceae bacterium]